MPYELKFTKVLESKSNYINECCFGGDIVIDLLFPAIEEKYSDIQSEQEDWGWFMWFKCGESRCAIDVFCDDAKLGHYIIHLNCRDVERKYLIFKSEMENKYELEILKSKVVEIIQEKMNVKVSSNYDPKLT
jgi:hypothetical protein